MSYTVIIPARYASSRLPGKPLMDIAGKPMIQHVWERAGQSAAQQLVIATEDQRVFDACKGFGAQVCMTRATHESGTDRLQEVVQQLGLPDNAIVVNVQGDEPMIPVAAIEQVAANLAAHPEAGISTLMEEIGDIDTVMNPNVVKVVADETGFALYFSRAPIPYCRDGWQPGNTQGLPADQKYWRHIGIYGYRVGFLNQFVQWPLGKLEGCERLEQLRAMENGVRIHVQESCVAIPGGVDTQADLEKVRQLLGAASG
ncbi:3-deoxy-manno-octulosonate cytidylyltransferase [Spongiibacter sp. KMU-166]|uniref:3-deoxy-manno-octulosonate cytidylyltransferase n=1 Tax=Spongiibacter thalassae TaxID=2721624 RepID=A0ABX1GFM2_9GAMM|nr:3-deoxy-manno-octulosonate cytidylyltransferase [Spongiibacter thalassae]NKI17238.1 3-deoxy-manno-octulosonate cytidylyltransferase [Spongiibacter thalassae]